MTFRCGDLVLIDAGKPTEMWATFVRYATSKSGPMAVCVDANAKGFVYQISRVSPRCGYWDPIYMGC